MKFLMILLNTIIHVKAQLNGFLHVYLQLLQINVTPLNGENILNIQHVSKTIKDAITIHKEKYDGKISRQDITNTVLWCCQQNTGIRKTSYDSILKYHLTLYDAHI